MMCTENNPREAGFSLLELLIVVAITMVVAAVAIPNVWNSVQQFRLRLAASDLAGLIQKDRMLAVSQNKYYGVRPATANGRAIAWVDLNGNYILDANEWVNSLQLPQNIVLDSSGSAPSNTSMSLGFSTGNGLPVFTPRGLPCFGGGGGLACAPTGNGYIQYLRQDRSLGSTGWAAVTVSPAGRVRTWTWNGNSWQ